MLLDFAEWTPVLRCQGSQAATCQTGMTCFYKSTLALNLIERSIPVPYVPV